MAKIRYNHTAILDKATAQDFIYEYFKAKESQELAEKHIGIFLSELEHQLDLIERHPELYPIRRDYYYEKTKKPIRSFNFHWFIAFYVYEREDDEVTIWFIRPSKSDYSDIIG